MGFSADSAASANGPFVVKVGIAVAGGSGTSQGCVASAAALRSSTVHGTAGADPAG